MARTHTRGAVPRFAQQAFPLLGFVSSGAALGTQPQSGMAEIRENPAPCSQEEADKKDHGKPESGQL